MYETLTNVQDASLYPLLHSFDKSLLMVYEVSGAGHPARDKADKNPCPLHAEVLWEKATNPGVK